MENISAVLSPEEIINPDHNIHRDLFYGYIDCDGKEKMIDFSFQDDLSILSEHPVIMDVLKRNLKLPVQSLMLRNRPILGEHLVIGFKSIQAYFESNPGFLSYRFGIDQSMKMKAGIDFLLQSIELNNLYNHKIKIRYRNNKY
jgi:hypothetical protein